MEILVAGVDEAGRGPLAGPVVAAAVILDPDNIPDGLADSKKLTPARRERLFDPIRDGSIAWAIAEVSVAEIDRINILQASLLAMQKAVAGLSVAPARALVDGNRLPALACPAQAIIKGDQTEPAISAASILAKVHRDRLMCELDAQYPGYGLAGHKGYPTRAHIQALHELGVTPIHRTSYAPVRQVLEQRGGSKLS
ncbi:MAG TPA: ribonuclease HII [Gammaproteobacteria bacterium]|nr:ribonuclease HII [Gammaproteobacteria bacterium]